MTAPDEPYVSLHCKTKLLCRFCQEWARCQCDCHGRYPTEPCESCATPLVHVTVSGDPTTTGFWQELQYGDGRSEPQHTPQRCRDLRVQGGAS